MITPIPVTAKTAFLMIDNFIFPSSVHQLFCGNIHITILTIADIHTIASIAAGILILENVNCQRTSGTGKMAFLLSRWFPQ